MAPTTTLVEVTETWDAETVVLSYIIAVTGSFCTIQIMEQWRLQESAQQKRVLLLFASIALGGCGIWAMHFTGMNAQHVRLSDGSEVRIDFELGQTIVSLLFPIAGVFIGLTIASRDAFFLEIEHERRKAIVADQIRTMSITEILKKGAVQRKIKFIALFSNPWRILMGGLCAALGVLGMHYLGMMAQRSVLMMAFDAGFVGASCVIAFITATAAFWIIFRALTFWPCIDILRIGSALIMGIAVCGTHYTGMAAARYSMESTDGVTADDSGFIVDGGSAFRVASNGSLVLCFWLVSLTVVRDLRVSAVSGRGTSQQNTNGNHSSHGMASPDHHTAVVAFRNSSVPRNAVRPEVVSGSTGPIASGPLPKATAVARLLNKQKAPADQDATWDVVPGPHHYAGDVKNEARPRPRNKRAGEMHAAEHIKQHWSGDTIVLSYAIAVTGSYCTIQLMEQWRAQESKWKKLMLMWLSAIALGGCGIWCMHFTGMNALNMTLSDGTVLEVNFEGGITILSLVAPIVGVFLGLRIASTDPFFLEVEASRRKELLTKDLQGMSMEKMIKNKSAVSKKIKFIALFSRLWRIIAGGLFAALGVLAMHYLGMMAQRMNANMELNAGIVALSSVIAFGTANAAFWILFRALTFWPGFESLRMGSALIMGVAVCGTHYSGMGAASYTYTEENYSDSTRFLLRGSQASTIASHAALLLCYWLSTFAVVVSLRKEILSSQFSQRNTTMKSQAGKASKAPPAQSQRQSEAPPSKGPSHKGPSAFNAVAPAPPSGPSARSIKN